MSFLYVFVLTTIISILVIPLLDNKNKSIFNLGIIGINALLSSIFAIKVFFYGNIEAHISNLNLFGDILLKIDAISAWFILIINFTVFTGAIYAIGYMKLYENTTQRNTNIHYLSFIAFHLSMLMICILQNWLAFLFVWEIMTLSSFLLVIFESENERVIKAGINYFIQMHLCVAILTIAVLWVHFYQNSFSFDSLKIFFANNPNKIVFLLFFIGFGVKAGLFPLHTWLPHAHPAAPSHVSGIMSGVIVKLGIYGIIRVAMMLNTDLLLIGDIVLIVGIVTGLIGIINAASHRDFKVMLAYCTIENIGIILIGIGVFIIGKGLNNNLLIWLGLGSALLHVLNHSLYKSMLFYGAGSVYQQTHTRNMDLLGGLIRKMPVSATFFLIGSMAICGLPPLNGFISEFMLYNGLLEVIKSGNIMQSTITVLGLLSLALIGGLSLLTFTKSFSAIFLGTPRIKQSKMVNEMSFVMILSEYIIILVMLIIGLFPMIVLKTLIIVFQTTIGIDIESESFIRISDSIKMVGWSSVIFLALLGIIYIVRQRISAKRKVETGATWGCGSLSINERQQYTATSYSKSTIKLLRNLFSKNKSYEKITEKEIFPKEREFSFSNMDLVENKVINKIINQLLKILHFFGFIQNGKIQVYVLYGLIFISFISIITIFSLI